MGNIAGTDLLEKVRSMGVRITLSHDGHNLIVSGISERLSVDLRIVLSQRKAELLAILRCSVEQKPSRKTVYVWKHRGWILKPVDGGSGQEVALIRPETIVDMHRQGLLEGEAAGDGARVQSILNKGGPVAVRGFLALLRGEQPALRTTGMG